MILIFFPFFALLSSQRLHVEQRESISRQHLHPAGMASDPVEHIICRHGGGRNSWQSRRDMDRDGAQANEDGHELFYRFVAR